MSSTQSWNSIKNFPTYEISNFGNIRNKLSKKIISGTVTCFGTKRVSLTCSNHKGNKIRKVIPVYRLVAQTFIDNPNNYNWIKHKDGNLLNNNVSNLEWVEKQPQHWR